MPFITISTGRGEVNAVWQTDIDSVAKALDPVAFSKTFGGKKLNECEYTYRTHIKNRRWSARRQAITALGVLISRGWKGA